MKYKAIILDLDDTTVVHGKDSVPTARVAQAIARAKRQIHVCVATARMLPEALPVLNHLALSGPCVITDGAQIYDPMKKKVVYEKALDPALISDVYNVCQTYSLPVFIYDGIKEVEYKGGSMPEKILRFNVPRIEPFRTDRFIADLGRIHGARVQKLAAWNKQYMCIGVTNSEASKLHGIIEIARILHIKTEEIIGVGDGYNDFPLLMACGLKIAMGNAVAELKAIADFIAPTVYEDGVATVIEKFVLQ